MSKRKLNRRQQWRIEKIQAEKTVRAEKKQRKLGEEVLGGELGAEQRGLIIAHFGQSLDVEALEGESKGEIFRCFVRANIDALVTGDKVIWRPGTDNSGIIEARLDRESLLQRPDNFGQLKPVAANVGRILIVVAPEPTPFANLIDRYLVAAETTDIEPVILFNKSDLINEANKEFIHGLIDTYKELGYEVLLTSANDQASCATELSEWLANHISVFVGQSGVGKSSLIRSILGDQTIRIGDLSENTRKGTHTTTTAKLFHLPSGGQLVDSPGIREFGLWHITEEELLEGFIEFRPFIGYCRFRDCKHEKEPGCAIQQALEYGKISETRMQSYRHILSTLDEIETY